MGMHSWNCNGCGHPLLRKDLTGPSNEWMCKVVWLRPAAWRAPKEYFESFTAEEISARPPHPQHGEYDGYCRIELKNGHTASINYNAQRKEEHEPTVWHSDCWEVAGKPLELSPSSGARCQGIFCDGTIYEFVCDHNMESPLNKDSKPSTRPCAVCGEKPSLQKSLACADCVEGGEK